jgi:hypothetical protein
MPKKFPNFSKEGYKNITDADLLRIKRASTKELRDEIKVKKMTELSKFLIHTIRPYYSGSRLINNVYSLPGE